MSNENKFCPRTMQEVRVTTDEDLAEFAAKQKTCLHCGTATNLSETEHGLICPMCELAIIRENFKKKQKKAKRY